MGKRILMVKQEAMAVVFAPRGKAEGLLVRVAGPDIPDDCQMVSFAYIPPAKAIGIVLESAKWSELLTPGQDNVNGIAVLPFDRVPMNFHLLKVENPALNCPDGAIAGYDDPQPIQGEGNSSDG